MFDQHDIALLKGMLENLRIDLRDELHATEARLIKRMDCMPQLDELHARS